jgi:uncharacterized protein (TIGR02996 family)
MTNPMPPAKSPRPDATLAALYKAVLANPDDDLPRLVYADRLDELGDHPRAEFIRLQCHVVATNPWDEGHADALVRSQVLYDRHAEAWGIKELTRELMRSKGVAPLVFDPFVRGFPEVTWANIETFSAAHRKTLKKYPIRELVLVGGTSGTLGQLGGDVHQVGARTLDLSHTHSTALAAFTNELPLPTVRTLVLSCDNDWFSSEDVGRLARCVAFPNVETVQFAGHVDEEGLLEFVRNLRWPSVRSVYLYGEFNPRVQAALADAGWVGRLDTLSLEHSPSGDVGPADQPAGELTPLFRSMRLTKLRSLSLDTFPFSPAVERAFVTSKLRPLDHFAIEGWCDPPVSDWPALLASPALVTVKSLDLPGSDTSPAVVEQFALHRELRHLRWETFEIPTETWAALAASPLTQSLRRLHLERAELTVAAAQALLAGRPWPHLAELVLKYWKCDGRAVAKLIDHPHFARLTHLDLPGGPHAATLWKAVAKSKTVGRFHKLRLGFAITDKQLNAVLDNPEVGKIGKLALPNRVKIDRKTQRRYEKVFGVRITRDW